jgi:glutamate dehydrogenase
LSIAQSGGASAVASQARLMEMLEEGGHLDRKTEGLADSDTFIRRAAEGRGLTRPELAVLLSSCKLVLQAALEASSVVDDPALSAELTAYFPPAMQAAYAADIADHRLRREILATRLANRMINRMGFVHPFELAEEEGVGLGDVAAAFIAAEQLLGMQAIWAQLESADMPETARIKLFDTAAASLRPHMADLLRVGAAQGQPLALAAQMSSGVNELASMTDDLLAAEGSAQSLLMRDGFIAAGAPVDAAAMVTRIFDLDGAVGLASLALTSATNPTRLTRAFTDLGTRLGLDWAQGMAARMQPSDPWERLLIAGLARDFQQMRLDFLRRISGQTRRDGDPIAQGQDPITGVETWAQSQAAGVKQFRAMVGRAQLANPVTPAMLAQIASQARNLLVR